MSAEDSRSLPPGVTIAPPPAALELNSNDDDGYAWCHRNDADQREPTGVHAAMAFPERIEVEDEAALRTTQPFACSGSVDSTRYQEATRFRAMPDMGWEEARVALNRLLVKPPHYGVGGSTRDYVALAEFALTAQGFEGFDGRKGEHAVKLRRELAGAIDRLRKRLDDTFGRAEGHATTLARPITARLDGKAWRGNDVLWAMVPTAPAAWVRIIEAAPEQAMAALEYLRATLTAWEEGRLTVVSVLSSLRTPASPPTAAAYAEASHIADMLAFLSEKLLALYAGIMHSMPVYRLYPATSEPEAMALWWPWGHCAPLFDGVPPRPPKPRKQVLDPAIITATRPQEVVREVMVRTGINRTTAQRMTADMRADMRQQQQVLARTMLHNGQSRAAVARAIGLSPSRISAMFKGQTFPTKNAKRPAKSADC